MKKTLYYVIITLSTFLVVGTVLSLWQDTDWRYLKMLDFPRLQFFWSSVIALPLLMMLCTRRDIGFYLLGTGVLAALLIQSSFLVHYTGFVKPTIATTTTVNESATLKILMTNVKMSNREVEPLLELIQEKSPDIVLAMEVNKWWNQQLISIEEKYSYVQETINEAAYGMTLYSIFPLINMEVVRINNENVPSFHFSVRLKNGQLVRMHTVHPPPPTYYANLPDNAQQEEVALEKVGNRVQNDHSPTIVLGDFNDVAWSKTTCLMQAKGKLHDVRVGRGMYNSYDATNPIVRWPLDHFFVTKEFKVKKLERLPKIGSDHFPMYVELVLYPK